MAAKLDPNKNMDEQDVFNQFSEDDRDTVKEIWEKSRRLDSDSSEISEDEVESALSNVHQRMDRSKTTRHGWKWSLAAAVVLMAFGLGYLLWPQTVTVPRGEVQAVTLPDGSTVELNSGSEIQYSRFYGLINRSVQLEGEGFFSVQEGEMPFTVRAHGSAVRVTGTQFNVRSWNNEPDTPTEVTVAEGTVQFYPDENRKNVVNISSGQLSFWKESMEAPSRPKAVSVDEILGWRNQELVFNKQSLQVIFQELERRFDVDIRLEAVDQMDETLTTYYARPQNVESILQDICRYKGLRYAKTANGYRVFK